MKIIKTIKNVFSKEYSLFLLSYVNSKGKIRSHVICDPLNQVRSPVGESIGFRTYSFGRGIRFFLNSRVLSKTRIYHLPDLNSIMKNSKPLSYDKQRTFIQS